MDALKRVERLRLSIRVHHPIGTRRRHPGVLRHVGARSDAVGVAAKSTARSRAEVLDGSRAHDRLSGDPQRYRRDTDRILWSQHRRVERHARWSQSEPRVKALVLSSGGVQRNQPAEVNSWNFAPRVHVPVLMLNGRDDFIFPVETNQKALFRAFGTRGARQEACPVRRRAPQSGNAP